MSGVGFALCVGLGYLGATVLKGSGSETLLATLGSLVSRAQAAVPRVARESTLASPAVVVSIPQVMDSSPATGGPAADGAALGGDVMLAVATMSSLIAAPGAGDDTAAGVEGAPAATSRVDQGSVTEMRAATERPAPDASAATPPRWVTRIAEGRTPIGTEGLYATRQASLIRVYFDTELGRTRRPDKFEQIVRATLPVVFGASADSLLQHVPAGSIGNGGDLLADLPVRGIELRHPDGRTLRLWPETRPGRDGPIVVSYRVDATR